MTNRTTAVVDEPHCDIHYLSQQCGFDFVQIAELVPDSFVFHESVQKGTRETLYKM